jgi:hypothetical protein
MSIELDGEAIAFVKVILGSVLLYYVGLDSKILKLDQ